MAKRNKSAKRPKTSKEENIEILDEKERRNMEYAFIALFAASIVFLLVYLVGLINILFKFV